MSFIKRGDKYLYIMEDGTEYEVDDDKLTKEKKDKILFHHKHSAPVLAKLKNLEKVLGDVLKKVKAIEEAVT